MNYWETKAGWEAGSVIMDTLSSIAESLSVIAKQIQEQDKNNQKK